MIVTPMILLAYAVEGRKRVQATSLDPLFSFVGAALLIASGGMVIEYIYQCSKNSEKSAIYGIQKSTFFFSTERSQFNL